MLRRAIGRICPSNNINVVVTDRQVRVDTLAMERLGSVASLLVLGRGGDRIGLSQPLSYPREQVQIQPVAGRPRVQIGLPDGRTMVGKTDLHVARQGDVTARTAAQHDAHAAALAGEMLETAVGHLSSTSSTVER